jgi:ABC-2 type transport system permease protein
MSHRPSYLRVFYTLGRNSLVRDMTFRTNFIIQCVSSLSWTAMNLGFYLLIFTLTPMIGKGTGWGQFEFLVFLATTYFVNSLVQTFFMPNAEEFSELIRTGGLDFVLLKPIDTQFIISVRRVAWSQLINFFFGLLLLAYAVGHLEPPGLVAALLYPVYVICGVLIMYSLMLSLSATSVWLGRNQTLYNFWFYITNFSRYPMEIYRGNLLGESLNIGFTYMIPVLVVINVPARLLAKPLEGQWNLALFALIATVVSLLVSRWIFRRSLLSYRSASS